MSTIDVSSGGAGPRRGSWDQAGPGSDVQVRTMSPDALATYVKDRLEDRVVDHVVAYGQLTVTVAAEAVPIAVQLCRDDPRLAFDFFDFMCGVDEREDGFAVVTHLYSTRHRHHIQIRALATGGREAPRLPSITHLYRGADWHEREAYDMYGIEFEGHPGLLPRILTVENFEGFPLRKDFLLMTREVKPWPGLKEPKEVTDEEVSDGDGAAVSTGPNAEDKARMAQEKAERAKQKAAEARRRRARERAEGGEAADGDVAERAGEAAPADGSQAEQPAGDDEVGAEKEAALAAGAGDDEIASDPREAAEISGEPIAKDAAAGAVSGDTAAGASGDVAGRDEPIEDRAREAELAGGGPARASGTPGVEAEGRHAGADEQAGDRPASETAGMTSDTQEHEPARDAEDTPAADQPPAGEGLPPRGPGQEEPRALAGEGVESTPLAEEVGAEVGGTYVEDPGQQRPIGTDADDRIREREAESDGEDRP